jgi:hypothetical protein
MGSPRRGSRSLPMSRPSCRMQFLPTRIIRLSPRATAWALPWRPSRRSTCALLETKLTWYGYLRLYSSVLRTDSNSIPMAAPASATLRLQPSSRHNPVEPTTESRTTMTPSPSCLLSTLATASRVQSTGTRRPPTPASRRRTSRSFRALTRTRATTALPQDWTLPRTCGTLTASQRAVRRQLSFLVQIQHEKTFSGYQAVAGTVPG